MSGRDSREDDQRHRQQHEAWEAPKKASVWPLLATVIAAYALKQLFSFKKRPINHDQFSQQAYGPKAQSTSSRGTGRTAIHYTYVTRDGRKIQGYAWRETSRVDDPWARFWKDGYFDIDELERLERTRIMQEVFHRVKPTNARSYEAWEEYKKASRPSAHQTAREDWTWGKADWDAWRSAGQGRSQTQHQRTGHRSVDNQHYENLGLDPSKAGNYSQDELKAAFRTKAMEYHPDRNQHRKEYAEAKFREMLSSYEALKKNSQS